MVTKLGTLHGVGVRGGRLGRFGGTGCHPSAALALLARRGVRLGTDWTALADPAAEAGGAAVAELVMALAALRP